jgi:hypothetical protein
MCAKFRRLVFYVVSQDARKRHWCNNRSQLLFLFFLPQKKASKGGDLQRSIQDVGSSGVRSNGS